MKKLLLTLLCLPIIVFGQQANQTKIVKNTANIQLDDYLNKIPVGKEKLFGFNDRDEFMEAEIGNAYEVFTVNTKFFEAENLAIEDSYITTTNNWRVVILVNNEYRALLTVSKENNEWQVVKLGAKGLANELNDFSQEHPQLINSKILRVFQLKADFIVTSQNIIYPLTSGKKGLLIDNPKDSNYSIHDILLLIKKYI